MTASDDLERLLERLHTADLVGDDAYVAAAVRNVLREHGYTVGGDAQASQLAAVPEQCAARHYVLGRCQLAEGHVGTHVGQTGDEWAGDDGFSRGSRA